MIGTCPDSVLDQIIDSALDAIDGEAVRLQRQYCPHCVATPLARRLVLETLLILEKVDPAQAREIVRAAGLISLREYYDAEDGKT
jgi:hypothetical protein